jgi:hypothetical protein
MTVLVAFPSSYSDLLAAINANSYKLTQSTRCTYIPSKTQLFIILHFLTRPCQICGGQIGIGTALSIGISLPVLRIPIPSSTTSATQS